MLEPRHSASFDPLAGLEPARFPPLLGAALEYDGGTTLDWHSHPVGQLVYAASGTMRIESRMALYIVPPLMAVWVPAGLEHAITMQGPVAMRTLYLRPGRAALPPQACAVLRVAPLLRELSRALGASAAPPSRTRYTSLCRLILEELKTAPHQALSLAQPHDRRLAPLVSALLADPGDGRSLTDWSHVLGASARTIERLFLAETRLSFRQWRQQARLLQAVQRLSQGEAVTSIALDLGYASPSAFTYMFRRTLGVAPSHYDRER